MRELYFFVFSRGDTPAFFKKSITPSPFSSSVLISSFFLLLVSMFVLLLLLTLFECSWLTQAFQFRATTGQQRSHILQGSSNGKTALVIGQAVGLYEEIHVPTLDGIHFTDITPDIKRIVASTGITTGSVTVLSRHTTTAITINEMEGRLVDDARYTNNQRPPKHLPTHTNTCQLSTHPLIQTIPAQTGTCRLSLPAQRSAFAKWSTRMARG